MARTPKYAPSQSPRELGDLQFAERATHELMEELRTRVAAVGLGVTLNGPYLTLRFYSAHEAPRAALITVSALVVSVTDSSEFEPEEDK